MIKMIAGVSLNGVIGEAGNSKLLWDYPEDLVFFRKMTCGQTIIMGNNTYRSIGRPLPKRKNIVVSAHPPVVAVDQINPDFAYAKSYTDAFEQNPDAWIIGGISAYQAGLRVAGEIYITTIPEIIPGKNLVYFPFVNPHQFNVKETLMVGEKLVCTVYKRA